MEHREPARYREHISGFDTWSECFENAEHSFELYVCCMAAIGGCPEEATRASLWSGVAPAGWRPPEAELLLQVSGWRARSHSCYWCAVPLPHDPTPRGFKAFKHQLAKACRSAFSGSFWGTFDVKLITPSWKVVYWETWCDVSVNRGMEFHRYRKFVERGGGPAPRKPKASTRRTSPRRR